MHQAFSFADGKMILQGMGEGAGGHGCFGNVPAKWLGQKLGRVDLIFKRVTRLTAATFFLLATYNGNEMVLYLLSLPLPVKLFP